MLLKLDVDGTFIDSFTISNGVVGTNVGQGYNMFVAGNGLIAGVEDAFYFAGWSNGFKTSMQNSTKGLTSNTTDAFLYRFTWDSSFRANDCLQTAEISEDLFKSVST